MLQFQPQINIRVPSRRLWQWQDSKSFIYTWTCQLWILPCEICCQIVSEDGMVSLLPTPSYLSTWLDLSDIYPGTIGKKRKPLCLGCNNHFLTKVSPIIRNEEKNKHIQIPSYCQGEKVWLLTLLTKFKYVPFKTTTIHIYPILTRLKSLQINNKIHHSRVIHHLGRSVYNYITIVISPYGGS